MVCLMYDFFKGSSDSLKRLSLSCLWVPIGLQFLVSHLLAKVAKNYLLKKKKKEKKKKSKELGQ